MTHAEPAFAWIHFEILTFGKIQNIGSQRRCQKTKIPTKTKKTKKRNLLHWKKKQCDEMSVKNRVLTALESCAAVALSGMEAAGVHGEWVSR